MRIVSVLAIVFIVFFGAALRAEQPDEEIAKQVDSLLLVSSKPRTERRRRSDHGRGLSSRSGLGKLRAAVSLIPNFDFVAIRVGDVGVGVAWAEFASPEQLAAGVLDIVDGRVDVAR